MKYVKKLCCLVLAAALIVGAFFLGRFTAPERWTNTFYATILEKYDSHLIVEGLEVNDINSRGQFQFNVDESVELQWRYTQITLDDLDVGDTISITYTGSVMEISPAIISEVLEIQLLDDEK